MNYKDEIYKNYISNHNVHLYGSLTIDRIRKNHKLWDYLYGKYLPVNKHSRILDIGCGEGAFIDYLVNKGYQNPEGIDISEEQISLGKKLGIENIRVADIYSFLSGKKSEYDFVVARDVLEHFSKQQVFEILFAAKDALCDNGIIMIQVPNAEGIWHEKIFYGDFTHETLFSRDSVRQVFNSVGFSSVDSFPLEFPGISLRAKFRKLIWKCFSGYQRFRKWAATGDHTGIFTPNILVIAKKQS
jgi:2-polyprenyl-3-methyl-5-hydroxy-6-metoxy-1,4-benzoquinol methylase